MDDGVLVLVVAVGIIGYMAYKNSQTNAYWAQYSKGVNAQANATANYWAQWVAGLGNQG